MPTGRGNRLGAINASPRAGVAARAEARGSGLVARGLGVMCAGVMLLLAGCEGPSKEPSEAEAWNARNDRHVAEFGNFDLPRTLGSVENVGLQIPVVSPDGQHVLYLRSDQDYLSPMTLLGSSDPRDTPAEGTLSVWIRPVEGSAPGQRLSSPPWAHSPVWSDSGRAIAYVANEPPVSCIVHHDLQTGTEARLGLPDAVNCLPRFDGDDETLLFCSGEQAAGPFRIYRQTVGDGEPVALTPEGTDCVLPLATVANGDVLCARLDGDCLNWVRCGSAGMTDIMTASGVASRPGFLQTWAGIGWPLSPDRESFLFFDTLLNRVRVCYLPGGWARSYRFLDENGNERETIIAACWLTSEAIAVATPRWLLAIDTIIGKNLQLLSGSWIPARYVPAERRLLLLGSQNARRFAIKEVVFTPR